MSHTNDGGAAAAEGQGLPINDWTLWEFNNSPTTPDVALDDDLSDLGQAIIEPVNLAPSVPLFDTVAPDHLLGRLDDNPVNTLATSRVMLPESALRKLLDATADIADKDHLGDPRFPVIESIRNKLRGNPPASEPVAEDEVGQAHRLFTARPVTRSQPVVGPEAPRRRWLADRLRTTRRKIAAGVAAVAVVGSGIALAATAYTGGEELADARPASTSTKLETTPNTHVATTASTINVYESTNTGVPGTTIMPEARLNQSEFSGTAESTNRQNANASISDATPAMMSVSPLSVGVSKRGDTVYDSIQRLLTGDDGAKIDGNRIANTVVSQVLQEMEAQKEPGTMLDVVSPGFRTSVELSPELAKAVRDVREAYGLPVAA